MSFLPIDYASFLSGVALGVIGAFGAGFLKKAGEDCYSWIRSKINSQSNELQAPHVIIHLAENSNTSISSESPPGLIETASIERVSGITFKSIQKAIEQAPPL